LKILVSVVRFRPGPPRTKFSPLLANVKTAVLIGGCGFFTPAENHLSSPPATHFSVADVTRAIELINRSEWALPRPRQLAIYWTVLQRATLAGLALPDAAIAKINHDTHSEPT
jgi:hypothetical protein